jgi:FAD-dependent urate hydroxylase
MSGIGNAIVIGGGIAGPVAAMALRRAGIEATVYESYGSAEGVGGALSIAPNGRTALAAIDAEAPVAAAGRPMRAIVMQSWTGKRLAEFGSPAGLPPMLLVWRADLYRALYDEAARRGVRVEHGKRLVALADDPAPGGRVVAHFADGTSAAGDVLIGADGIRSTVRRLIDPAAPEPRHAGLLGFGARTDGTGLPGTGDAMHMVFGKRAFFGYQIGADESGWFANLPHPAPMSAAEARRTGAEEWLRRLAAAFAGDRTPAVELIRRTAPEDLVITGGLEDIPTVPTWHRGRVVLAGDAAHATSPSSGAGCLAGHRERRATGPLPARPSAAGGVRRLRAAAPPPGGAHHQDGRAHQQRQGGRPGRPRPARPAHARGDAGARRSAAMGVAVRPPDRLGRPGHAQPFEDDRAVAPPRRLVSPGARSRPSGPTARPPGCPPGVAGRGR